MRALAVLFLAAFASTGPVYTGPVYPGSTSKGFTLIAKVIFGSSRDLANLVNNRVVVAAHTGAGFNVAVLYPEGYPGSIFYQNGTTEQVASGETTIINDEATPPSPFGMQIQSREAFDLAYPAEHSITVNAGPGSKVSWEQQREMWVLKNGLYGERGGSFVACNNTVPYYRSTFFTLMYLYPDEDLAEDRCVGILILPKCAILEDLPDGAYSSHKFAVDVACYDDPGAFAGWIGGRD